ncbi:11458_t:CDS:1, partial [Gigaspora margarita]
YNRDRLYERYEKWKNKTHTDRQNILNLQVQILLLQNNPYNMAEARRLPILKYVSTLLNPILQYIGQMPP